MPGDEPAGQTTPEIPTATPTATTEADRGPRPVGVTILAVLNFLFAVVLLAVAGLIIAGGAFLEMLAEGGAMGLLAGLGAVVGGLVVLLALAVFVIGWGLWTGRGWAWALELIFAVIGILFALVSMLGGDVQGALFGLVIDGLILYYLTRPGVAKYFEMQHALPW